LKRFADTFKMNIAEVQTTTIEEWLESLEVSARTRVNFRTLLITFFKFARRKKYLPKDQSTAADDLEAPTTEGEDIEIYTHTELQQLINKSDVYTLPVLCLGAFAGLRAAEIERLAWSSVLDDEIEIRAKTSKNRSRRLVPILPPLAKALRTIRKPSGLVVDHIKIQYRLRGLADEAEVPRKANALRHSFASYRMAAIKNANQVGHLTHALINREQLRIHPSDGLGELLGRWRRKLQTLDCARYCSGILVGRWRGFRCWRRRARRWCSLRNRIPLGVF
jgi:integrase